jgi:hypothetical protein
LLCRIKEAEEAWEKNSERLELEQEAALRGLNKAAKEADLRAKLASLDAQIAKESISPAFLKTLVHPPRYTIDADEKKRYMCILIHIAI